MYEEPAKRNDVAEEGDSTIHWTVTGGMPEVPKIELPAEVVQNLSDTSKRYSDMFASVAVISEAYGKVIPFMDTICESVNSISSVLANLPDYTSMVQGGGVPRAGAVRRKRQATGFDHRP